MKLVKIYLAIIFALYRSILFGNGFNDTIHSYDLLNSANFRYADFLQYSTIVDVSSTDFYHWKIGINDLTNYSENRWELIIDNHLVKPQVYGERLLNQLALSNMSIDSVEIIGFPQFIDGIYSDKGVIRIHTRKPSQGFNIAGSVLIANESGDPGPYKYTDRSSPNVDKIGHDNTGIVEYAYPSGFLRLSLFHQQHTFTDPAVICRIKSKTNDWPGANKAAAAFDFRHQGKCWSHSVLSSISSNKPYFLFIDIAGQEFPMQTDFFQWSYSGNRLNTIHWYLDYNHNRLRQCKNAIQSLKPYIQHNIDFRTDILADRDRPVRIGYRFVKNIFEDNSVDENKSIFYHQMNVELTVNRSNNPYKLHSSFTYFHDKVAGSLSMGNAGRIWKKYELYHYLSISQRQLSLSPYYQFWTGPGKPIVEEYRITFSDYPERYSLYSGGIGIKGHLLKMVWADVSIMVRYRHENWWRNIFQEESNRPFRATYSGLQITFNHRTNNGFNQKISLRIKFKENHVLDQYSAVKAVYRLSYQADRNFILFLNSVYQNDETWDLDEYFSEIGENNQNQYSDWVSLNERIWFEAGFNKWCWDRRLLVRVAVQNISNQQYQYHSLGMNREMSMIAGLYFWLKGS